MSTTGSHPSAVLMNNAWTRTLPADSPRGSEAIARFHRSLPGFAPTELISLPALAAELGVAQVLVKVEAERIGLPSFKIMGASWAVAYAIAQRSGMPQPADLAESMRIAARLPGDAELTAATDGNHGRAVARMARLLGIRCHILVPDDMAPARIDAIRAESAEVEIVRGDYDATVRRSAERAEASRSRILVSDTSWEGYRDIPAAVVEGYSTIVSEVLHQLGDGDRPPMVAVAPVGVGAFASAVVEGLRGLADVVTVEPRAADCLFRSLEAGHRVAVPGPHASRMAGLNCGEVSLVAWDSLLTGVRAAVRVSDDEAGAAVRELAAAGIASSDSGASALAAIRAIAADDAGRELMRPDTTVLLFDTEGVTDEEVYAETLRGGIPQPAKDVRA